MKGPSKSRFEEIFANGRKVSGPLARLIALPGKGLMGFATAKKIGDRPARNRVRRRFQAVVRENPLLREENFDYVLILSQSAANVPYERIENEVRELFAKVKARWASELESS